jgi:hypothetical protein
MSASKDLSDLRMDATSLYREELFTDRRLGTIRQLIPVTVAGTADGTRPIVFEGQTTLLTPAGPLPLRFEIEATTLAEALERFGGAAQRALEQTLEEAEELRRRSASSLIVPGRGNLGLGDLGNPPGGRITRS